MELAWNPHEITHPEGPIAPRFYAGLDIGQMTDPTALAILQRELLDTGRGVQGRFLLRYLERVPLMTPYPTMAEGVRTRLKALGEPCHLICDATGVGRPIVDLFRVCGIPIAVTVTTGERIFSDRFDEWHVPKRILIMGMQVAMQQGRLLVSDRLPEGKVLVKELQGFTWKPTKMGNDSYGAWRDGEHDDLLFAVAIAIWYSSRFLKVPGTSSLSPQQKSYDGPGNPLRQSPALTRR